MGAILILDADGQWLSLTTSYDKVWRLQRWGCMGEGTIGVLKENSSPDM